MCGINAIFLSDPDTVTSCRASAELCEGLGVLQHRGQDAAGIVTCGKGGRFYQCKANGMVRDVFNQHNLTSLIGYMGIGHVRYPTAGTSSHSEAQPFYVNSPYGIALAHNGNLTNAAELKNFLDHESHRHVNTDSDSELLLNIFASHLQKTGKFRVNEEDIFTALRGVYEMCSGGYAVIAMIAGFGVIAFRDPHGIRPLVIGERVNEHGTDYMVASESVCLDQLGFTNFRDVKPGEAYIITKEKVSVQQCVPAQKFTPCIFEYVYFGRPDSIIDGISVYRARLAMGEGLANQVIKKLGSLSEVDVIMPVPDTSRICALQLSYKLGILYREGFIKNAYVGRTFIMPDQNLRRASVRRKLNAMPMEFAGKNVLLVDDSIVRGTTSKEIVQMAREAGAKKVFFASAAPPLRYPNVYGIDMPTSSELIAFGRTEDEVADAIGADAVIYQTLDDLVASCRKFNKSISDFETSVFTGDYVTGITKEYLNELEEGRRAATRAKKELSNGIDRMPPKMGSEKMLGLHNNRT